MTEEYRKQVADVYSEFYFVSMNDIKNKFNDIIMLLDERNKMVIGILVTNKNHDTIKMLTIKRKFRRKGHGKRIFNQGCKMLKLKMENMLIESTESPTNSIDFWKTLGFQPVKTFLTKKGNKMKIMEYKEEKIK